MTNISKLLQEARPLYLKRKRMWRTIRYNCLGLVVILALTPTAMHVYNSRTSVDSLYTELYANDGIQSNYYIDEFDALGII